MTKASSATVNVTALNARLRNAAGQGTELRLRSAVATTVVAQVMPAGAVKGGTAMKLRLGYDRTRFTRDLDVARHASLDVFVAELEEALSTGWGGFTGRLVKKTAAKPTGVPAPYVMQPYEVKLAFQGKPWLTVPLELGHDEIGDTEDTVPQLAGDLVELFVKLGLPTPQPVPVLATHHQVAQKLHACTAPGSDRAHDLVDLQLLAADEPLDLHTTATTARRLFASRHVHEWPPQLQPGPGWSTLYTEAAEGLAVRDTLDAAVAWTNELIVQIDEAGV